MNSVELCSAGDNVRIDSRMPDRYEAEIQAHKNRIIAHPVFQWVDSLERMRRFMEHHVVCVWDFMVLLKSIQHEICPTSGIWRPPINAEVARLINEIVLVEESDLDYFGQPMSHFEMYLGAMDELGANTKAIRRFIDSCDVASAEDCLANAAMPKASLDFARQTLSLLNLPLSFRINVFFHTRENLVPKMFVPFVDSLEAVNFDCSQLKYYLMRHIEVDEDSHGPMAEKMLRWAFEGKHDDKARADQVVIEALQARCRLWSSIINH